MGKKNLGNCELGKMGFGKWETGNSGTWVSGKIWENTNSGKWIQKNGIQVIVTFGLNV